MAKIVGRKLCTDKMIKVVYRAVVLAKLAYLSTGQCLTSHQINQIEVPWRKILKNKSGLPSSAPNSLIHSQIGHSLPRLADAIFAKDAADFQVWLSSLLVIGDITRGHFRDLQELFHYPAFPGTHPNIESPKWRSRSKYAHFLGELKLHNMRTLVNGTLISWTSIFAKLSPIQLGRNPVPAWPSMTYYSCPRFAGMMVQASGPMVNSHVASLLTPPNGSRTCRVS